MGVSFEHVVVKETIFYAAIGEGHDSTSMLNTLLPLTFVHGSIRPVHLTIPHTLVVDVLAIVDVATLPGESTISILFIELIISFISVALGVLSLLAPLTFAIFHSVFEFADVYAAVFPFVDTLAVWLALRIVARVHVAIGKDVRSFAVFEAVGPGAFISVPILPLMHTVSMRLRVLPLAEV